MTHSHQTMQKPRGQILKEAREGQGISLDAVHEATKIPLDVLRAIEEGYTVRTLSAFYLKGFIKMYAQYLNVDVNDVLEDYHVEKLPELIKEHSEIEKIQVKWEQFFTHHRQQQVFKFVVAIIALFFIGRLVGCLRHYQLEKRRQVGQVAPPESSMQNTQGSSAEEMKKEPLSSGGTEKSAQKANSQAKDSATMTSAPVKTVVKPVVKPVPTEPVFKKINLTVKAKSGGWLQVKVDGNLVYQSMFDKGVTETWTADEIIEISGKSIHHLEYEMNGKMLGALGRADRKAKRVVITRDGLAVR